MPKSVTILSLFAVALALLPQPASAAQYLKIENRSNSCPHVTLYGVLRTFHGSEIKLEGPSRPRSIAPNENSTFGPFPEAVEHVRVQVEFRPPRDRCNGSAGVKRSYMLNAYGQKHVPNYIYELQGSYPNVHMR
jgi:hypothetical protein